ncbi:glycerol ether metabolic process [Coemansia sp. RSA 2706]|nr:glycerol ether metabolic process [Coemansia sp. RSA 2711]KAJ1833278.1 glycerol ether metabolic process [Coemansia sp. RSA 2708]KAJ2300963.1 glycerol ether metabolic process [Coemansia sp. RSA 2706]KAJ2311541.1 glycerol ether metabolic process [Coemansia sp. RSA 2704]KAJ2357871.1 glycerol ether metabolic process [Coemansia sp. RSA 2611]KAJ2363386.1 glycerol ether metabolic process [Coemansia sp. RSA 2610]
MASADKKVRTIEVESKEQFAKLIKDNEFVAIDFTATWCGPCKLIGPKFNEFSVENQEVVFLKVDVDALSEIAQEYNIRAMPTFKFVRNGKEVGELVGANPTNLKKKLAELNELAVSAKAASAGEAPEAAPAA